MLPKAKINIQAILFDLDGTLADTVLQLAKAASESACAIGISPPSEDVVRGFIGNGIQMLLARIIKGRFETTVNEVEPSLLKKAREEFNKAYATGLQYNYRLYDGVEEGLKYFKSTGIKLGVVTNKPQMFAIPLLKHMKLFPYFDFILGGEVIPERKPAPEPILYCLEKLGIEPYNAMMVGDSDNDILASNRAGTKTVFLTYGYNHGNIDNLRIDYRFNSFTDFTEEIKNIIEIS